jgi:hypothetical protein
MKSTKATGEILRADSICVVLVSLLLLPSLVTAAELHGTVIQVKGKNVTIQLDEHGFLNKDDKVEIYQDAYGVKIEFGTWKVSAVNEDDTIQARPEKTEADPQLTLDAIIHTTGSKLSHSGLILHRAMSFHWGLDDVEQNIVRAIGLYRKSAELGNTAAANNLCEILSHQQGGQADYAEALQWCLKTADEGSSTAQAGMGHLYTFGKGVKTDLEQAEEWYRRAEATAESAFTRAKKHDPDTPDYRKNYLLSFHADLVKLVNDSSFPARTRQDAHERGMKLFYEMRSEER